MMQLCLNRLSGWLIRCQVIEPEERELYEYAAYCLLLSWVPTMILFVASLYMGMLKEAVLLNIPFITIRKYSGGFHMKTARRCIVCSCILLTFFMVLTRTIHVNIPFVVLLIIAAISLMLHSPITSVNHPINDREKVVYHRIAIGITGFYLLVFYLLYRCHFETEAVCIALGLMLSSGLQVPCLIGRFNKRKTV